MAASPADLALCIIAAETKGLVFGRHAALAERAGYGVTSSSTELRDSVTEFYISDWNDRINVQSLFFPNGDPAGRIFPQLVSLGHAMTIERRLEWIGDLPVLSPGLLLRIFTGLHPALWPDALDVLTRRCHLAGAECDDTATETSRHSVTWTTTAISSLAQQPAAPTHEQHKSAARAGDALCGDLRDAIFLIGRAIIHRAGLLDLLDRNTDGINLLLASQPLRSDTMSQWEEEEALFDVFRHRSAMLPSSEALYWYHFFGDAAEFAFVLAAGRPSRRAVRMPDMLGFLHAHRRDGNVRFSMAYALVFASEHPVPINWPPWLLRWGLSIAQPSRASASGRHFLILALARHGLSHHATRGAFRQAVFRQIINSRYGSPANDLRILAPPTGFSGSSIIDLQRSSEDAALMSALAESLHDGVTATRTAQMIRRGFALAAVYRNQWLRPQSPRVAASPLSGRWIEVLATPGCALSLHAFLSRCSDDVITASGVVTWSALLRAEHRDVRLYWIQRLGRLRHPSERRFLSGAHEATRLSHTHSPADEEKSADTGVA